MYKLIISALALALLPSGIHAQAIPGSTSWYLFDGDPSQVRQYVLEVGKGPTVVVIHGGFGADHSYLLDAYLPLAGKYRLVFYDQRGSLRSPPGKHEVSLPTFVEDLDALRQQLGEDKLVLLTHSMGGATAMAYLLKYPARVRGLVLTAPVLPTDKESDGRLAPRDPDLLNPEEQSIADGRFARFWQDSAARVARVKAMLPPVPVGPARATPGHDRQRTEQWRVDFAGVNIFHVERWRQLQGGKAFYRQEVADAVMKNGGGVSAMFGTFRPSLERFPGPVEVVMGDNDFIDPGAFLWSKVVQRLPDAKLTVLPAAGHNYWIDQPRLSVQALERALARAYITPPRARSVRP